ncbi:MAG: hypothetical protein B7Y41_08985 [Hydrogenophilales bacterium 28-61-23]|nr:MAG: hypothetical protein B7Y41_08985 [Hydrogenophilales bacterium 28-61-23]
MTDGLSCECHMPLAWYTAPPEPGARHNQMREAALLLTALNQMEGMHEHEANGPESRAPRENRRLDRIEAKLDLTLHLLARSLETGAAPPSRRVRLAPGGAQWQDPEPPTEGTKLILELYPAEALPLSLKLPATALAAQSDNARVEFDGLTEALDEALYQFIFRLHRQAIRARTA